MKEKRKTVDGETSTTVETMRGQKCSKMTDCGNQYTQQGCLINHNNEYFVMYANDEGLRRKYVSQGLKLPDKKKSEIPTDAQWDMSMFQIDKEVVDVGKARNIPACEPQPLMCSDRGVCEPTGSPAYKSKSQQGCLARTDTDLYLLNKVGKTYHKIGAADKSDAWYASCQNNAPLLKQPDILDEFCSNKADCPDVEDTWGRFWCTNATPCLEDDVPGGVVLTSSQIIRANIRRNNPQAISKVCEKDPNLCSLFTERAASRDVCAENPLECARAIADPTDRCNFLPQSEGCPFVPPPPSEKDIFMSHFTERKDQYNHQHKMCIFAGCGFCGLLFLVAVALVVRDAMQR